MYNKNYKKTDDNKRENFSGAQRNGDYRSKRSFDDRSDRKFSDNKKFPKKVLNTFENNDTQKDNDDFNEDNTTQLIIGRNPVIEALKAEKLIDTIYVNNESGGSIGNICRMARELGVVVKNVSDIKLNAMSNGASHQGVIAVGACAEYKTISEILDIAKEKGEDPFVIICDEIEDPHNLGAIIRTAESAGAHGIIIPKRRSASLNHTVFKTSAGAASWLPVARVSNIPAALEELKQNGVWIYGTDSSGEDYTSTKLTGSIGLVIGSEGFGMGRLVKEKCDFLLKLPMLGKITSLNASVAGGIFMYEIVRQRNIKK